MLPLIARQWQELRRRAAGCVRVVSGMLVLVVVTCIAGPLLTDRWGRVASQPPDEPPPADQSEHREPTCAV